MARFIISIFKYFVSAKAFSLTD